MILYTGGIAQGKRKLAEERFGNACRYLDGVFPDKPADRGEVMVILHPEHLMPSVENDEEIIKEASRLADKLLSLEENGGILLIISEEMGCGVVPVDKKELFLRECAGRLQIEIAKRSKEVIRVIAGLAVRIK